MANVIIDLKELFNFAEPPWILLTGYLLYIGLDSCQEEGAANNFPCKHHQFLHNVGD